MIPKSLLRSSFEHIVKTQKNISSPVGSLPVLTWLITLDENTRKIYLNAVTRLGLVPAFSSFPFGSVTSAYQFMVRL